MSPNLRLIRLTTFLDLNVLPLSIYKLHEWQVPRHQKIWRFYNMDGVHIRSDDLHCGYWDIGKLQSRFMIIFLNSVYNMVRCAQLHMKWIRCKCFQWTKVVINSQKWWAYPFAKWTIIICISKRHQWILKPSDTGRSHAGRWLSK